MLLVESQVIVSDNTQTRIVKCIRLLGGSKRKYATVSDFIIIAVKQRRAKRRLILKKIYLALIIASIKEKRRLSGYYIKSKTNRVLLLTEFGKIIGTRILGPVYKEVKQYSRISKLLAKSKGYI